MTALKDHTPIAEAQQDFKCSRCTRTDFETKGSTNTMNPRLSFESGRISYFPFKDPELKLTYSLPQVGTFARVQAQTWRRRPSSWALERWLPQFKDIRAGASCNLQSFDLIFWAVLFLFKLWMIRESLFLQSRIQDVNDARHVCWQTKCRGLLSHFRHTRSCQIPAAQTQPEFLIITSPSDRLAVFFLRLALHDVIKDGYLHVYKVRQRMNWLAEWPGRDKEGLCWTMNHAKLL